MPSLKVQKSWAIVLVAVLLGLAACGGSVSAVSGSSHSTPVPTATIHQGPLTLHIGDTLTYGNSKDGTLDCTLTSVQPLAGDDFTQPKAGFVFLVAHVKFVNHTTSEQDYNVLDFNVLTSSGNISDTEFVVPTTYTANNQLQSGTLAPGGTVEGDIIIQAPQGDHGAKLTWSPGFGQGKENGWLLGL